MEELSSSHMETVIEWVNNENVNLSIDPITVESDKISARLLVEKDEKLVSVTEFFANESGTMPLEPQLKSSQALPIPSVEIKPSQVLQYYTMGGMVSLGSFALQGFQQEHEDILIKISEELKDWFDQSHSVTFGW